MTRRYFYDDLPAAGGVVRLGKEETEHAIRVMRVQVGDPVEVFDGKGHQAVGTIASVGRSQCVCELAGAELVSRMPAVSVTLAVALPKPDRAKEMILRLTELGVARVVPIVAHRTQRAPSESVLKKLRRAVVEACKQSGRNTLMTIDDSMGWDDFLSLRCDELAGGARLIAHPGKESSSDWVPAADPNVCVAIGPEGGWTDEEVQAAANQDFQGIDLGPRIYRIETAAAAIASVLTMPR